MRVNLAYFAAILVITFVSAYDTVLTHITADQLLVECIGETELCSNEQNPLCEWIILQRGNAGLVEYKATGVLLATVVLFALSRTKYRWLIWVTLALQLLLFWHINFSAGTSACQDNDILIVPVSVLRFYLQ